LTRRYFEPLEPPQSFDPLVVDQPSGIAKQSCDPAIAVTTILAGQLDHVRDQAILVVTSPWGMTLRRAVLS
jgi:hypothetical protein